MELTRENIQRVMREHLRDRIQTLVNEQVAYRILYGHFDDGRPYELQLSSVNVSVESFDFSWEEE